MRGILYFLGIFIIFNQVIVFVFNVADITNTCEIIICLFSLLQNNSNIPFTRRFFNWLFSYVIKLCQQQLNRSVQQPNQCTCPWSEFLKTSMHESFFYLFIWQNISLQNLINIKWVYPYNLCTICAAIVRRCQDISNGPYSGHRLSVTSW